MSDYDTLVSELEIEKSCEEKKLKEGLVLRLQAILPMFQPTADCYLSLDQWLELLASVDYLLAFLN